MGDENQDKRALGILGGMGPEATSLLFQLIIHHTPARADQEHLPVFMANLPQIHDRTAAILKQGPSPVPQVVQGLKWLEQTPAICVLIPCNTIFFFYPDFAKQTRLPIVHLMKTVALSLKSVAGGEKACIGVLATDGTRRTGLYESFLQEAGFRLVYPDPERQAGLMEDIYAVKAGKRRMHGTIEAVQSVKKAGADFILLACTELSILYDGINWEEPVLDALRILADTAVKIGLGEKEPWEYVL